VTTYLAAMSDASRDAWHALMGLQVAHPTGWTLVGGQMVHLLCAERGATPTRATDDVDTVLDVRAAPGILMALTSTLSDMGFEPSGNTWQGHQHRWVRHDAVIDLLIPRHLGERAAGRTGSGGGTTLETPAAQQALDRTENVQVDVAGRQGIVRRPNLLGALVAKAAAYTVLLDRARDRHITDFAVLATLIRPDDHLHTATNRDRHYLNPMLAAMADNTRLWSNIDGAREGRDRLSMILESSPRSTDGRREGPSWSRVRP